MMGTPFPEDARMHAMPSFSAPYVYLFAGENLLGLMNRRQTEELFKALADILSGKLYADVQAILADVMPETPVPSDEVLHAELESFNQPQGNE